MCRIAGIINLNKNETSLRSAVKDMCKVMAHGGPDDEGFYDDTEEHLSFGHRRLALIDLTAAGHQPMFYSDDQLVITFNGEIYNYLVLKENLTALGYSFKTKSDTEVILASYAAWGIDCFDKLKGMFAFALYDRVAKRSYLVRDKSGIKPLYYSTLHNSLTFASEVKAFNQLQNQYHENPDWRIYFLAFGHIPEPHTTYLGISALPKGHYLCWNHSNSSFEIKNYQIAVSSKAINNSEEAVNQVAKILKQAVKRHLTADAPIGVFLSGGIDSSVLTLLADDINQHQAVNTLSINFDQSAFSEKKYQDLIVDKIKGEHSNYHIDQKLFSTLFPKAINAMDQPSSDGINSWFVNYFAKEKGLKAVLSGIGADELFGGYPSFKRMRFIKLLVKLPPFLLKAFTHFPKALLKRAYYLSYKSAIGEYLFLRGIFTPIEIAELLNLPLDKVNAVLSGLTTNMPDHLSAKEKASWLETNLYMQNQLLKDTDTMSMQHGIEVRTPFLDEDVISLVSQIKSDVRFGGKKPKGLLIAAFKNILPQAIWDRPKMGFTFPFQYWLQEEACLNQIPQNNAAAQKIMHHFKTGQTHWSKVLTLYLLFNKFNNH